MNANSNTLHGRESENRLLKKLVDSTAMIAFATSVLYLVGEVCIVFSSYGFGYPTSLLTYQVWEVIGVGGQAIATSPFLLLDSEYRWQTVLIFIAIAFSIFFLRRAVHSSLARTVALAFILVAGLVFYFAYISKYGAEKIVARVTDCLAKSQCTGDIKITTVNYQSTEDSSLAKVGYLVSAKGDFILLKTMNGFVVIPKAKVISIGIGSAQQ